MQAKQVQEQGRVKWFNAKAGYGFVTVLGSNREVFVHHSGLKVGKDQFRYLVEGEYVELEVSEMVEEKGAPRKELGVDGGSPRYQGKEVRGIGGGKLMCETRSESSASTSQYKSEGVQREKERRPERERKERKKETVVQQMRHTPKSELD